MNHLTARIQKLERYLIPEEASAYLTAQTQELRQRCFLSLSSYFREYQALQENHSRQTNPQTDKTADTLILCHSIEEEREIIRQLHQGHDFRQGSSANNHDGHNPVYPIPAAFSLDAIRAFDRGAI